MVKEVKRCLRLFRSKKGDSHVDWVIAGSMFILFLSYFFMLVRPVFFPIQNEKITTDMLEENLKDDLFWTLQKVPLLVNADGAGYLSAFALRAKITFTNESGMILSDNTSSFVDNGYFFTIKPINGTTYFDVTFSNQSYDAPYGSSEMQADYGNITTHDLWVQFQDSVVDTITYHSFLKISDVKISFGNYLFVPQEKGFVNGRILGKYLARFGNLNSTYYVYAGVPTIDQRIDSQYDTSISMTIHDYDRYHVDTTINGNETGCFGKTADSIIFLNEENELLMQFNEDLPFVFCKYEDNTIGLNISIGYRNESWIRYSFFQGNLDSGFMRRNITYKFGIPLDVVGISHEKLVLLNMTSYGLVKTRWGYPRGRDFRITLINSTTQIGPSAPEINVFAKNYNTYFLDKLGNKAPAKFALQAW